ncbi:hypothetical protein L1887_25114 [Cichorium endivia]|nr:hypothetical protein L1887_25114 [Cichorium endivia]
MVVRLENLSKVQRNEVDDIDMLCASYDNYDGVIVDVKENMDENVFIALLQTSISQWRHQGKKGVWLKLSLEHVNLVKPAVKEGFWYHHAEPTYLMLVYWIPKTNHTLPSNASHRVGVAAFVLNSDGKILVVQEKSGVFKGTGVWKLPTGSVEEGEDICTAAIREVKEETGQDSEILEAKWMPIEEYANQPFVKNRKSFEYIANICIEKKDNKYVGFNALPTRTATSVTNSFLYSHHKEQLFDSHIQEPQSLKIENGHEIKIHLDD